MTRILGQLEDLGGGRGAVRIEDRFETTAQDLWSACTDPERLARWIAEVHGELHVGGTFRAVFTSGAECSGEVLACEPPHRLLVRTRDDGAEADEEMEVRLVPDGTATRLVLEERGIPLEDLPAYGAGCQIHVEHLRALLDGVAPSPMAARWRELEPIYRGQPISRL
ncbi:SRPBCC family protein [Brachybacterium hainanense]|uniref:SRPBCC family protein n=1 Tax=Brachybacterium hainanense TaxID=1541174 RepID=A0ABV6RE71_9MICO